MNFLCDLSQSVSSIVSLPTGGVKICLGFGSLISDVIEELQESFRVCFKHVLRASETILSHGSVLGETLDFLLFCFQHLLDQEHLALLLNKLPSILSILGPLNGNSKASCLRSIDLLLHLRINCKLSWLNISFTNLTKASFSSWSILLVNFQLLVLFSFDYLSVLLSFFE